MGTSDVSLSIEEQMLSEYVRSLDATYNGEDGPRSPWAPSGERYVTVFNDRIKPEGEVSRAQPHDNAVTAVCYWVTAVHNLIRRSGAVKIYWRERPSIESDDRGRYVVVGRLAMTDKAEAVSTPA